MEIFNSKYLESIAKPFLFRLQDRFTSNVRSHIYTNIIITFDHKNVQETSIGKGFRY